MNAMIPGLRNAFFKAFPILNGHLNGASNMNTFLMNTKDKTKLTKMKQKYSKAIIENIKYETITDKSAPDKPFKKLIISSLVFKTIISLSSVFNLFMSIFNIGIIRTELIPFTSICIIIEYLILPVLKYTVANTYPINVA